VDLTALRSELDSLGVLWPVLGIAAVPWKPAESGATGSMGAESRILRTENMLVLVTQKYKTQCALPQAALEVSYS